jgi:hypothetical protein
MAQLLPASTSSPTRCAPSTPKPRTEPARLSHGPAPGRAARRRTSPPCRSRTADRGPREARRCRCSARRARPPTCKRRDQAARGRRSGARERDSGGHPTHAATTSRRRPLPRGRWDGAHTAFATGQDYPIWTAIVPPVATSPAAHWAARCASTTSTVTTLCDRAQSCIPDRPAPDRRLGAR